MQLDDNEDLSKLDRGDNFEPARDEKGRFAAKTDGDGAPEEQPDDAPENATEPGQEGAEPEADDDGEEGDDAAAPAGKDDKNYAIRLAKAKSQRDQARAERAELAAKLAEFEAKLAALAAPVTPEPEQRPDPRVDLEAKADGLYEKIEAARADGDVKQAAALQRELDTVNRQISRYEAAAIASNTTGRMTETQTYNSLLDTAESVISALNPADKEFDRAAVAELQETIEAYEARGLRPSEALKKAVKAIYRVDLSAPDLAPKAPAAPAAPAKPAPKAPNVSKAVEAAKRQPPDASSRGVNRDEGKITVEQLSEDDLAKLPASKRAELRGDFV